MITLQDFERIVAQLHELGWAADDIAWSEGCKEPASAEQFAFEAIFVICNSGMKNTVARQIFEKVCAAIQRGKSADSAFRHIGKARAIDEIWSNRQRYFAGYMKAPDKVAFCDSLPFIGGITKYHLAKNFGAQVAKPDVHLKRLADLDGCSAQELCERLSLQSGYKVATVDVLLWRACANGVLDSRTGRIRGAVELCVHIQTKRSR
jgi:hypothetical protein